MHKVMIGLVKKSFSNAAVIGILIVYLLHTGFLYFVNISILVIPLKRERWLL